jgi:hypothetical protein
MKCRLKDNNVKKCSCTWEDREREYQRIVGPLKKFRTATKPCFFCKKQLDENAIFVKVKKKYYVQMHKLCKNKRLQQINRRKRDIEFPVLIGSPGNGKRR